MMGIATESVDGCLTGGTGLPTTGRSARAGWKAAAELACVRWLLRVVRLLVLASWQMADYRRAGGMGGLRQVAGAVTPGREREQQTGAPGGTCRGGPKPR